MKNQEAVDAHETENDEEFKNTEINYEKLNREVKYDFSILYDKANQELVNQQQKRDQIIAIYLAIFSFIVPFALSMQNMGMLVKGIIFSLVAIIGVMFALIIVRYRVYKEVYWLCCQALTNLMSFKHEELDKATVQAVYYRCMWKKGNAYVINPDTPESTFDKKGFFQKNIFSGETIYFLIHAFITAIMSGFAVILILSFIPVLNIIVGILVLLAVFVSLVKVFFDELMAVYYVLVDHKDKSFNKAFSKAWFLHFYID
ncbi:MAG: hypothetical protein IJE70_01850 [Oscillospiraceae bacterium]|nr:hypothetical protein [Oscillospiraceae bacterium]